MLIYGTKNFFAIISIFTFHFLFFSFAFLFYYFFCLCSKWLWTPFFSLFNAHWINGVHRNSFRNGVLCVLFMLSNTHLLIMFWNTIRSMLFIPYDVILYHRNWCGFLLLCSLFTSLHHFIHLFFLSLWSNVKPMTKVESLPEENDTTIEISFCKYLFEILWKWMKCVTITINFFDH